MLATVAERLFVEGLENDLHLLFKKLLVGVVVNYRSAEALHLTGVIAPAYAKNQPPSGKHVGHGKVFSQAHGVPHGNDVERRAELKTFGQSGQVHSQQYQVGKALVALPLEMVLRGPHAVIAQVVHVGGQRYGIGVGLHQLLVGIAAVVGGCAFSANVLQVNLADIQHRKTLDHR